MTKKGYRQTFDDTAISTGLLAGAIFCGTGLYYGQSIIPDPILWAGLSVTGYELLKRNSGGFTSRRRLAQFERTQQLINTDEQNQIILRWHDRRDVLPDEFIFSGLGLPVDVPEGLYYDFLCVARKRQTKAVYHKTIRINWVLSESYFTKQHRPRFVPDHYKACLIILGYARLMTGKRQGSSGYLIGDWGPDRMLEISKARWASLLPPARLRARRKNPLFYILGEVWGSSRKFSQVGGGS